MPDLETMRRNPGSVSRRDLIAALHENGWVLDRTTGKHQIFMKGARRAAVPHTLKGTGTIRALVEIIIESRT